MADNDSVFHSYHPTRTRRRWPWVLATAVLIVVSLSLIMYLQPTSKPKTLREQTVACYDLNGLFISPWRAIGKQGHQILMMRMFAMERRVAFFEIQPFFSDEPDNDFTMMAGRRNFFFCSYPTDLALVPNDVERPPSDLTPEAINQIKTFNEVLRNKLEVTMPNAGIIKMPAWIEEMDESACYVMDDRIVTPWRLLELIGDKKVMIRCFANANQRRVRFIEVRSFARGEHPTQHEPTQPIAVHVCLYLNDQSTPDGFTRISGQDSFPPNKAVIIVRQFNDTLKAHEERVIR